MQIRPLAVGAILFGVLVIGGTLDGARRKLQAQPDWVALNWRAMLRGLAAWLTLGVLAILGGVAAMLL